MQKDGFTIAPGPQIKFGLRSVLDLPQLLSSCCGGPARVLVVLDRGIAGAESVQTVLEQAAQTGHAVELCAETSGEPTAAQIAEGIRQARGHEAACIVGIGGGSVLDLAKLIAALAPGEREPEWYRFAEQPLPPRPLSKICVPTTAGTGSEVTRTAIFSDSENVKVWAWGRELLADAVLLDPELTLGLPPDLTAATGLDALVHAVEACTNRNSNPYVEALGHKALRLVAGQLRQAVAEPSNLEARAAMLLAAALAGMAIDSAGTGAAHAFGHALGTLAKVPHGRAVALALHAVLEWNAEAGPGPHARVAEALGVEQFSPAALKTELGSLIEAVGLPFGLAQDGLGAGDAPELADLVMTPANEAMRRANCREIDRPAALRFAEEILAGGC